MIKGFLVASDCKSIFSKIESMTLGGGFTHVSLFTRRAGTVKWARGEIHLNSDAHIVNISITRDINGAQGHVNTNRLDDAGLLQAVKSAENNLKFASEKPESNIVDPITEDPILNPRLWSDTTFSFTSAARTELACNVIEPVTAAGLFSAGRFEVASEGYAVMNSKGLFRYYPVTDVQCSVAVRDRQGTASGWAAQHNYDVARINTKDITEISLQKCQRSQNPVALEPGRYTVILEPQAVSDLFTPVLQNDVGQESLGFMRYRAEAMDGPFAGKRNGYSKINEQVLDRRLSLTADPLDSEAGFLPFERYSGIPYKPVSWIDRGILRNLSYAKEYALRKLGKEASLLNSLSYRMSSSVDAVSIDDMIKSTERGLLITRLSNVQKIDSASALCTGYTRDGLWLIEKGKISKPVKNFRFTESPLFVFNNVEAIGTPVRVFSPPYARVTPAIKVRDFSMTSLADAV